MKEILNKPKRLLDVINLSIATKYGNANLTKDGHYRITSRKEGNHGKLLHRLIYEDFHKVTVLSHVDVHHINKNKIDNRIENLILIFHGEHSSFHNTGENHPQYGVPMKEETKQKIRLANTGHECSLEVRKKISNAHKGKVLSEEHKKKLSESHKGIVHTKESKINMSKSHNNSGFYKVDIYKEIKLKQGFTFRYRYVKEDGKESFLSSISLVKLKEKVISKGLDWIILDKDKARVTAGLVGLTLEDLL